MQTELSFRSYDGLALSGTVSMAQQGPHAAAILVHGITSTRDELGLYSGLAEHLAQEGVASFRFDYRAHGKSTLPLEDMTLSGIVNDIGAAHRAFHKELKRPGVPVVAVGMSFGGGVTAMWAANNSEIVSMVFLLAPVLEYQHDILGQHEYLNADGIAAPVAAGLAANGCVDVDGVSYGRGLINELPLLDVESRVRGLTCPVTIIHGDCDSIVPYALSQDFVKRCPNCQLLNIAGTDHGFGVPEDEDLTWPETKVHQRQVYEYIVAGIRALQ